jgi:rRNA maturation protein Rpf1
LLVVAVIVVFYLWKIHSPHLERRDKNDKEYKDEQLKQDKEHKEKIQQKEEKLNTLVDQLCMLTGDVKSAIDSLQIKNEYVGQLVLSLVRHQRMVLEIEVDRITDAETKTRLRTVISSLDSDAFSA